MPSGIEATSAFEMVLNRNNEKVIIFVSLPEKKDLLLNLYPKIFSGTISSAESFNPGVVRRFHRLSSLAAAFHVEKSPICREEKWIYRYQIRYYDHGSAG